MSNRRRPRPPVAKMLDALVGRQVAGGCDVEVDDATRQVDGRGDE